LAEEEPEIGPPMGTKEWLLFGWECFFQWREEESEKKKAETGAQN
jgi:hypothetical protein